MIFRQGACISLQGSSKDLYLHFELTNALSSFSDYKAPNCVKYAKNFSSYYTLTMYYLIYQRVLLTQWIVYNILYDSFIRNKVVYFCCLYQSFRFIDIKTSS